MHPAQVGKSSIINSVAKKPILPTYTLDSNAKGPTTTVLPQEVTVDGFKFIDTPGVTWESEDLTEENRARDILLRNKGRIDRLKEPMAPGMLTENICLLGFSEPLLQSHKLSRMQTTRI